MTGRFWSSILMLLVLLAVLPTSCGLLDRFVAVGASDSLLNHVEMSSGPVSPVFALTHSVLLLRQPTAVGQ